MRNRNFEILIIGGGPAGLSAARTAARLGFHTALLERLAAPGELSHPCNGVIAPVPGLISGRRRGDGLYFPELDLYISPSAIVGYPINQRYASPDGHEFWVNFAGEGGFPVAAIDPAQLLRDLAEQAEHAGAELYYGTAALGLLYEGGRVAGVATTQGDMHAEIVLSAEGTARHLCEEARLYAGTGAQRRYAFIVGQELDAPAVRTEHLGQIVTLGQRYTSARQGFGTVILPMAGRAAVYFTVFADQAKDITVQSCWAYLDEYVQSDPRVNDLFAGATIRSRSGQRLVFRDAPQRVVADGLIGLGDAVTPGGHLGILPAAYTGRQAALMAAEALEAGNTTAAGLSGYSALFRGPVLRSLETESKLMMGLTGMRDDEIDRLMQTLQTLRLATPYFSNWRTIAWETIGWLLRQFPLMARDWDLLSGVLNETERTEDTNELLPISFASMATRELGPVASAHGLHSVPLRVRVLS